MLRDKVIKIVTEIATDSVHGGESPDILYLYSDRKSQAIYHCFFNAL